MTRARGASRPRFRLLPTVLLTLAILGVPTVVYAWGRSSSSFEITKVSVSSARLVPEKKALRLLRRAYVGRNLFSVTSADVRNTLEPLCFASGAEVNRDFPSTLAVRIAAYAPAAYALTGDRWYVLDESGYVICTAADAVARVHGAATSAAQPSASPSVSPSAADQSASTTGVASDDEQDSSAQRLSAGPPRASLALPCIAVSGRVREHHALKDKAAMNMITVITALPRSLRQRLDVVESDDGRLTLAFAGGPVVTWGDCRRTLAKTIALRTVLARYATAGTTCTRLDVSVPDHVLGKPVLQ